MWQKAPQVAEAAAGVSKGHREPATGSAGLFFPPASLPQALRKNPASWFPTDESAAGNGLEMKDALLSR